MVLAATVFLENALVCFQRLIDLLNRVVNVLGYPVLPFNFGIIQDMGEQVAGAAELVIGQNLDFPVPVIAGQIQPEQSRRQLDLLHRRGAMAMIIVVAIGQDAISAVHHARFRRVAELHRLKLGRGSSRYGRRLW